MPASTPRGMALNAPSVQAPPGGGPVRLGPGADTPHVDEETNLTNHLPDMTRTSEVQRSGQSPCGAGGPPTECVDVRFCGACCWWLPDRVGAFPGDLVPLAGTQPGRS